jgi:hypothetical protein
MCTAFLCRRWARGLPEVADGHAATPCSRARYKRPLCGDASFYDHDALALDGGPDAVGPQDISSTEFSSGGCW